MSRLGSGAAAPTSFPAHSGSHTRDGVLIVAFILLASSLSPLAARAESLPAAAKAAYAHGVTEYDLGHYKDALADFEKVYTMHHLPALLFNIAQCHRLLGELKEAAAVYRSFISRDPQSKRVEQARTLLDQVEAELAKQEAAQFHAPSEPAQPREGTGTSMVTVPANPTEDLHLVETAKPARPFVAPAPPPPAPAAPREAVPRPVTGAAQAQPSAPRTRIWTWVAVGGAAAATGVGVVLGAKSASTKSSLANSVHSGADVQSMQLQEASDAHRANSFFVAGAALAAIGLACFVLRF